MAKFTPRAGEPLSRRILLLAFVSALLFLYLRSFLLPAIPFFAPGDQTIFFARATRLLHGQVLYRDFFELVTPGTELLYAAVFRIFGIHAWTIQALSVAVGLALCCVVTRIAGRILRGRLVLLPALLFLIFDFSNAPDLTHHWYSTLAALGAVSVLMGGASLRRLAAAGLLCGIATLFTQTQGAMTFGALLVFLLWFGRSDSQADTQGGRLLKQVAALMLPFAGVVSCVLGYYIHKAGFRTIYFDLVVFPLRFLSSDEVNSPRTYLQQLPHVHTAADIFRLIPPLFIYAVVPYMYVFGLYQLWRRREELSHQLLERLVLLHLVGLALFLAVANGPRLFRLSTVAPPAILVCVWLIQGASLRCRAIRYTLCVGAVLFALMLSVRRQTQWHATLNLPTGRTAFSDVQLFHEFEWLAQRTHPSDLFFNDSSVCLYLSLENPTASEFVTFAEYTRPEQVIAVIESLQRHPTRYVLLLSGDAAYSNDHDNSPPFRQYLRDNYHPVQNFPLGNMTWGQEVWERNQTSKAE